MIGRIVAVSLRFRVLLVGIAAGLMALGVLSLRHMPGDVLPELSSGPVLEVQTEALGLSSQEVEQYVTVPLENNLLDGIMGVWDVRSDSIAGLSSVDLYFEPGTTMLHARQLVEERLTNAFSLPNVSKPPLLIQPLSSTGRVLMIGLQSRSLAPLELSYLARWIVKPRLSGVLGVANVAIFGQQDRQIQVQVDPSRLAARGVTLSQVIATAGNAQLVSPLTYLEGSSPGTGGFLDGPNQRLEIRPVLPLGAPRDLAAAPISDAPAGLRLGDVASVVLGNQPPIGGAVLRGGAGLVLEVQKLPSASVAGVTDGLERALADLRPALRGAQIDTSFFRPATYVASADHNLELMLAIGAALALLALAALFTGARPVAIGAISVSCALLVAALLLQALGYTLNALVTLGLLIGAVVVVEDAVGATHEIVRRVRVRDVAGAGRPVGSVVLDACAPLRRTLGYATLIVLVTIAPVFFAKGVTATFVHPMLVSFALAVLASMVVALTITPALGLLLFERGQPRGTRERLRRRIGAAYERLARRALSLPTLALAAICAAGLGGAIAFPFLSQPSPPTFRDRNLVVQWDGPAGASLTEMNRITRRAVDELRALPAVSDVAATLGRAVSAERVVDTGSGQIYVAIKPSSDYGTAVAQVRAIVGGTPGIDASVGTYETGVMTGVLRPTAREVVVRVYGQDYGVLVGLAHRVQAVLAGAHGLGPAHVALGGQEPNIEVAVNDAAALRAGALPGDARRQASTLVSGLTVGNFFQDQAVFDVVVWGVPVVRSSLDAVRNLLIDTSAGHARLGQIANVSVRSDPIDIRHQALARYVDVTAAVRTGEVAAAQAAVRGRLSHVAFPLQYHAEIVGGTPEDATSHVVFMTYALVAVVGVLLLLQAVLASWRLAVMLLLVLPVSLAGGLLVALLIGQTRSLGTDAGLLAVFVFSARQAILMIARMRGLQAIDGGRLRADVVVAAAVERAGPAVGAAVVAAAALLPFVVLGDVAGNELTHTAASVILGGLFTTALLNQVFLPALCLAFGPSDPIDADAPYDGLDALDFTASAPTLVLEGDPR
jgi:Cu/Ag efflux pump CusA